MIDISLKEYEELIKKAKSIDRINFLDIVHDYLLDGKPMSILKYDYFTVNEYDTTKLEGTSKTCCICNEIKPIGLFAITNRNGRIYSHNQCKECLYNKRKLNDQYHEYQKNYQKEYYQKKNKLVRANKMKTDPKYAKHQKDYMSNYQKEYRLKQKNAQ